MTALVTVRPRYASAVSFILMSTMAEISSGENTCAAGSIGRGVRWVVADGAWAMQPCHHSVMMPSCSITKCVSSSPRCAKNGRSNALQTACKPMTMHTMLSARASERWAFKTSVTPRRNRQAHLLLVGDLDLDVRLRVLLDHVVGHQLRVPLHLLVGEPVVQPVAQ